MDDLQDLPEPSRSRARALLTCTLCSQYFLDPRILPCRHSFCRKCLEAVYDRLQAASAPRRVGAMTCPTCAQPIGVPPAGMRGFPVDTKIARIKDLVINEMAQNISKKINGDAPSAEAEGDLPRNAARHFRDHSYDTMSGRTYDADDRLGGSYRRSSARPDFSKFARCFDHEGKVPESAQFKSTMRPDRHRVGYSKSFQTRQQRARIAVRTRAFDDASDLFDQSTRFGSAPHVGEEVRNDSGYVPLRQDTTGGFQRSRSARPTSFHERLHHSPVPKVEEEDDIGAESSTYPNRSSSTNEPKDASALPSLRRSQATRDQDGTNTTEKTKVSGSYTSHLRSAQEDSSKSNSGETGTEGGLPRRGMTTTRGVRVGRDKILREDRASNLPVHLENIPTASAAESVQHKKPTVADAKSAAATGRKLPKTPPETEFKDGPFKTKETKEKSGINEYSRLLTHTKNEPIPVSGVTRSKDSNVSEPKDKKSSPSSSKDKKLSPGSSIKSSTFTVPEPQRINTSRQPPPMTSNPTNDSSFERVQESIFETPRRPRTPNDDSRRPSYGRTATASAKQSSANASRSGVQKEPEYDATNQTPKISSTRKDETRRQSRPAHVSRQTNDLRDNIPSKTENGPASAYSTPVSSRISKRHAEKVSVDQNAKLHDGEKSAQASKETSTTPSGQTSTSESKSTYATCKMTQRTKEQMRTDARRSFSRRLHETMKKHLDLEAKDNETEDALTAGNNNEPQQGGESLTAETLNENSEGSMHQQAGESDNAKQSADISVTANLSMLNSEVMTISDIKNKRKNSWKEKTGRDWDELVKGMRTKYSLESTSAGTPTAKKLPVCADGVYSRWRLEKAEFGIATSMGITSKGCVIIGEYGQSCVEFYDDAGMLTHKMDGVKPFSIVINSNDHVIVGDRKSHAVRIFDEFGCDVAQWDATSFHWICGLAVLPNGQLAVYERERCKLGVYSSPGEKVREFSTSFGSTSDSQLCMADFIACDSHGRILIADSGNHCVKAFDVNSGLFVGKFGSRGKTDGLLDWPKGICVDADDNVIVTDIHNERVSVFTSSGQFVRHLITDIENPYSVCYSKELNAIGLTRYSLDGTSQYDIYAV